MAQGYDIDQAFPPLRARTDTRTLFGPTMGLVAVTTGLFTLGAYLARNLPAAGACSSGSQHLAACWP